MRASLLLEREPFARIAERTIARFWSGQFGKPFQVRWHDALAKSATPAQPLTGAQVWLSNTLLNVIFRPNAGMLVLEPIVREFARSTRMWRRPLQRTYVALSLNRWTARQFAHAVVEVSPHVPESHQWIVIPGNNKIRFLHRASNRSYCVLKDGFPVDTLRTELHARSISEQHGVHVPAMLQTSPDLSWFCEVYVAGTPANRVKHSGRATHCIREAATHLSHMAAGTAREQCVQRYVDEVANRALGQITKLAVGSPDLIESLKVVIQRLTDRAKAAWSSPSIVLSCVHGDFQDANVLITDSDWYVIDWEFSGYRQSIFDALVYDLAARSSTGFSARLDNFLQQGPRPGSLLWELRWFGWHPSASARDRQAILDVFLLEELELRIHQSVDRPLNRVPAELEQLIGVCRDWAHRLAA